MDNLMAKRAINELKYADDDLVFITVGIDFDGSVVCHRYPHVGKDLPLCVETLKRWNEEYGVGYILSTMRGGKELEDAINWFKERDIPLFGIQKHPTQEEWTDSPKTHCRFMIDDRNVGQPLTADDQGIPCIDWKKTIEIFEPTLKETYEEFKKFSN